MTPEIFICCVLLRLVLAKSNIPQRDTPKDTKRDNDKPTAGLHAKEQP